MTLKPTRNRAYLRVVALTFAVALATPCIESQAALASVSRDVQPASEPAPSGHPGYWAQTSCSEGNEIAYTEGWRTESAGGYPSPTMNGDIDTCLELGGAMEMRDEGYSDSTPESGPMFLYETPPVSYIAGGVLKVRLKAPHGEVYITTPEDKLSVENELLNCSTLCANTEERTINITHTGGWQLFASATCLPESGDSACPKARDAELAILSATIMLKNESTPTASGFAGSLAGSAPVSGSANLTFNAQDTQGPGVYRVVVQIDGQTAWSGTPNLNEGKCVASGTYYKALNFRWRQPCPQETGVSLEIPTSSTTNGQHQLAVDVEDAAGHVSTVLQKTITVENQLASTSAPPTTQSVPSAAATAPPERGPCNGSPCDEAAKLTTTHEPTALTRALGHSAITLTGRLTTPTGTPVKDAQVQLLVQVTGSASLGHIATATTDSDGTWALKAPAGPSRLLQVAYYSHLLDTVPASTLDIHESVPAAISMHAPHTARLGRAIVFSGKLVGGYVPAGGESIQMEIFYGGRWRTIEVLPTNSRGQWAYKYVFSLGVGASYLFRAATVPNAGYPFLGTHSEPVRVTVER
jgi:hypothetical protein